MKKIVSLAVAALFFLNGFAQKVSETTEELQKLGKKPAFVMGYDYPQKTVEQALALRLKNDKLKGKSSKGAVKYENVKYPTIANVPIDLYTKVTGSKKSASVYVFVSKGYENFVTSNDDAVIANNVKAFLASVVNDVKNYEQAILAAEKEKEAKKAQKEHDKLVKKQQKLKKEQDKVAKDIKKSEKNMKK